MLCRKKIKEMVYSETPIDEIYMIEEHLDFIEVVGYAGIDTLTYRFYNDGRVVEK